jgi:hypothetical protein
MKRNSDEISQEDSQTGLNSTMNAESYLVELDLQEQLVKIRKMQEEAESRLSQVRNKHLQDLKDLLRGKLQPETMAEFEKCTNPPRLTIKKLGGWSLTFEFIYGLNLHRQAHIIEIKGTKTVRDDLLFHSLRSYGDGKRGFETLYKENVRFRNDVPKQDTKIFIETVLKYYDNNIPTVASEDLMDYTIGKFTKFAFEL